MTPQNKQWIQIGKPKGLKELDIKDDKLIMESELLKVAIESNTGPPSNLTNKMPSY